MRGKILVLMVTLAAFFGLFASFTGASDGRVQPAPTPQQDNCNRDCLKNIVDQYVAALVRHDDNGQQHQVDVDLSKVLKFQAEDVRLQPSDILYVPRSVAKQTLIKTAELSTAIGSAVVIYRLIR